MSASRLRIIVLCVSYCCLVGCSGKDGPRRVAVRGSVIASEKMIAEGTIRFLPQAGTTGPIAITEVKGGLYAFSKTDGPYPGKYKVAVNLELSLDSLKSISQSEGDPPNLNWEEVDVVVLDQESATKHFLWEDHSVSDSASQNRSKSRDDSVP